MIQDLVRESLKDGNARQAENHKKLTTLMSSFLRRQVLLYEKFLEKLSGVKNVVPIKRAPTFTLRNTSQRKKVRRQNGQNDIQVQQIKT